MQAAVRLLKPGNFNHQITDAIEKVTESYGVQAVQGVLMHETKRHLIDGNNVIIQKATGEQRVRKVEFGLNEIYILDCMVSSGEGKPRVSELRSNVYKRAIDVNSDLRTKTGRQFFSILNKKFPTLAFSLRNFEDEMVYCFYSRLQKWEQVSV